jgi:hypothetical protein
MKVTARGAARPSDNAMRPKQPSRKKGEGPLSFYKSDDRPQDLEAVTDRPQLTGRAIDPRTIPCRATRPLAFEVGARGP